MSFNVSNKSRAVFFLILVAWVGVKYFQSNETVPISHKTVVKPADRAQTEHRVERRIKTQADSATKAKHDVRELGSSTINQQIAKAEYWFTPTNHPSGSEIYAPNRAQNLMVYMSREGLRLSPSEGSHENWSFALRSLSPAAPVSDGAKVQFFQGKGVTEWYVNKKEGLEHGMEITTRNSDPEKAARYEFLITSDLQGAELNDDLIVFRDANQKVRLRYENIITYDAEGKEVPSRLEFDRSKNAITWVIDHQGFQYPLTVDPLISVPDTTLEASDGSNGNQFGQAISISGDTMAVSAQSQFIQGASEKGAVYIFDQDQSGSWLQTKKIVRSSGNSSLIGFGYHVILDGDRLLVAAPFFENGTGAPRGRIYIYERNEGGVNAWGEAHVVTPVTDDGVFTFGTSIDYSNGLLVVGAADVSAGGRVYAYGENTGGSGQWGLVKEFMPTVSGSGMGQAVSLDGARLAVSYEGNLIEVYAHDTGDQSSWSLLDSIQSPTIYNDEFGKRVQMINEWLAVSQPRNSSQQGVVYLYKESAIVPNTWVMHQAFYRCETAGGSTFGDAMVLRDDFLLVGAESGGDEVSIYQKDAGGDENWGLISIFNTDNPLWEDGSPLAFSDGLVAWFTTVSGRSDSGVGMAELQQSNDRRWRQIEEIRDPLAEGEFGFGTEVALSSEAMAVSLISSGPGAVYLFKKLIDSPDDYQVVKKITSGQTQGDNFGIALEFSGDRLAVGAPRELVPQPDDDHTGQVHIYDKNEGGDWNWGEVKSLHAIGSSVIEQFGGALSFSGQTLAVAGIFKDNPLRGRGLVAIFDEDLGGASNWGQTRIVPSPSGVDFDGFATALCLRGDTLVAGYGFNFRSYIANELPREAFIYERHHGGLNNWGQVKILQTGPVNVVGRYGKSISLSGPHLAIGAPSISEAEGDSKGRVFIYERSGLDNTSWTEKQVLVSASDDLFGARVSMSQERLAVTSANEAPVGSGLKGRVFVYMRGAAVLQPWEQTDSITGCADMEGGGFGPSITLHGESLAVGDSEMIHQISGLNVPDGGVFVVRLTYQAGLSYYNEWRVEHFGNGVLPDPSLTNMPWSDLSDPDGDGMTNLEEAYRGLNPTQSSAIPFGQRYLSAVNFIVRWDRAIEHRGVQLTPYWSTDMVSWYKSGEGPVGSLKQIRVRNYGSIHKPSYERMEASVPRVGEDKIFLRFEFKQ